MANHTDLFSALLEPTPFAARHLNSWEGPHETLDVVHDVDAMVGLAGDHGKAEVRPLPFVGVIDLSGTDSKPVTSTIKDRLDRLPPVLEGPTGRQMQLNS